MGDPISLATRRALKTESSLEWSPRDMLTEMLRAIDAGEIDPQSVHVGYWGRNPDGTRTYSYYAAGLTYEETIALLTVAQRRVLWDWAGEPNS